MKVKNILVFFCLVTVQYSLKAQDSINTQEYVVDKVIGVVGSKVLKLSDVEVGSKQAKEQGYSASGDIRCEIFENELKEKLLVNQAMLDSLPVSDVQVEARLTETLNNYIAQIGSAEKLEKYFSKNMSEIKEDLRKSLRDNMLAQSMRNKVIEDIKITPTEVEDFYNKLPKDSLPLINAQVELAQLAMYPAYAQKNIQETKDKLLDLRKRILEGSSFIALAALYSEDPGSKSKGGEIGFLSKAELDPEYARAAFALNKPGEVSRIVESQFGYHIIQLVERKGDKVNTRHILMTPKPDPDAVKKVTEALDSIAMFLRNDSMKWDKAVMYYSMDENTRFNKGLLVNPQTGGTKFEPENLAKEDYKAIKNQKTGEISNAYESRDKNNKVFYKIITIKSQTPAHRANLNDDYYMLQEAAKNHKRMAVLDEWIAEKQKSTFINVFDSFKACSFKSNGWVKPE
jgi:peptidyl-prolyl cis-trans isomerase SurA